MNRRTLAEEALLHQGVNLERLTLAWSVVRIVSWVSSTVAARSVALAGFGLDSLVEIGPARSFWGGVVKERGTDK